MVIVPLLKNRRVGSEKNFATHDPLDPIQGTEEKP